MGSILKSEWVETQTEPKLDLPIPNQLWLEDSPADSHETHNLECSRAGERSNIPRSSANGAGAEASNFVSL